MHLAILLAIILMIAFAVILFPLGMIRHCARRSDCSGDYRAGWITAMLLIPCLGAYTYGLVASQNSRIKAISFLLIIAFFAALAFLVVWAGFLVTSLTRADGNMQKLAEQLPLDMLPAEQQEITREKLDQMVNVLGQVGEGGIDFSKLDPETKEMFAELGKLAEERERMEGGN